MLHQCERHAATIDVVEAATKKEKCASTGASNKKRSDQSDKTTKTSKNSKKQRSGNEKQDKGKTRYLDHSTYTSLTACHPLNKLVLEIMHIKRNDVMMVRPPPMLPRQRGVTRDDSAITIMIMALTLMIADIIRLSSMKTSTTDFGMSSWMTLEFPRARRLGLIDLPKTPTKLKQEKAAMLHPQNWSLALRCDWIPCYSKLSTLNIH
ncbi:hypothetical protein NE237_015531 [Protea cynaroides]|uniref:Uncharacterized protein n=1 Tax=Protea cynaroides TaxID=273540 RepID=A0A9Q0QR13_9MAGN|nr:hypothetical protein NE237_015531 [Protea cynaroides]